MNGKNRGKLYVVGFGPGHFDHMTHRAREAIRDSDVIVGYNTYVDIIRDLLVNQEIVQTGMTEEVSRAQTAVELAESGKKVAVISSGDAGVYGMAGLVYEVLVEKEWHPCEGVEVEVIPGVSAINSCAALLGSPVMHDACTISLSDHLTPWETIARRIEAAAAADFVIALYNPKSGRRTRQIVETQRILLQYRSPDTPVGLVKSAYRERQHVVITTLGEMLDHEIGMLTTVLIGNSTTFVHHGLMITPRGYQRKYTLTQKEQALKPHERLRTEAEPWSLNAQTEQSDKPVTKEAKNPVAWAEEALALLQAAGKVTATGSPPITAPNVTPILEVAVSSGVAEKKWTSNQMAALASLAGDKGEITYTPDHQMILRIPTDDPDSVVRRLKDAGWSVQPVGDVVQVKACDFCDGDKGESIPHAEELNRRLGGMNVPKELKIGFNGCAMACYGAVTEDIGIVYRRGTYDLFLGGKKIGRNAHPAQRVAEGLTPEAMLAAVENVVREYAEKGHPNERFHKFFKRVQEVNGFRYREQPQPVAVDTVCGD
ncbi:precorrin-3B C(17)-methyltransferase [Polycladomyces subterraneus]|uniref:Precorrin-3B C(17)-methyltransferase n=1 Tax=Polycladomyces subterraneus TaxID=1016997 RepID=A0ABT8IP40_9BACL|nr:precorrin-3B C(17)-methyltransferase [Polycladomyces subterraneus]MDN4594561.1 precorrin-3B C(17)-methyltransferase [Polycladomyces subterraneus]